jgi:hypothetical protein
MINPEVVGELRSLEKQHGVLKPEDVVQFARSPESRLHNYFTWEDSEAAGKYRVWEARRLIGSVVEYITVGDQKQLVPVFCSLTADREEQGGGYRSLVEVLARPVYRDQLLADALAELQHFQRKFEQYRHLAQFQPLRGVFREVKKVTAKEPKSVPARTALANMA